METKQLLEEELNMVSGGVLKEGWESTLLKMMALYKGKYGDNGKQMVSTLFINYGVGDGPLEEADIPVITTFIDNNWDSVEPKMMP
ncbi:MAG: hypothetical protein IKE28_07925 [Solobacterium sp.]|nr:hypothetical protein [Solobacterium sp.]